MAKNLTDVDTFTANVTVPEDGDNRTAASVEVPFQALANRTFNNKSRLDGIESGGDVVLSGGVITISGGGGITILDGGGILVGLDGDIQTDEGSIIAQAGRVLAYVGNVWPFGYTADKSFIGMVTGAIVDGGIQPPGDFGSKGFVFFGTADASGGNLILSQPPDGATITRIRAAVNLTTTPSSQQLEMSFERHRHAKTAPFGLTTTVAANLTKNTSGDAVLDSGAISVQIDRTQDTFECSVVPGQDGASGCDTRCYWIELTFTMPGPVRS